MKSFIKKTTYGNSETQAVLLDVHTFEAWVELLSELDGVTDVAISRRRGSSGVVQFIYRGVEFNIGTCQLIFGKDGALYYSTHTSDAHVMRVNISGYDLTCRGKGSRNFELKDEIMKEVMGLLLDDWNPQI